STTYFYNLLTDHEPLDFPSGTNTVRQSNHSLVARETHVFSARMVNELSGTLTHFADVVQLDEPGFTGIDPQSVGFDIHPQTSRFLALPSVIIASIRSGEANVASVDIGNTYPPAGSDRTNTTMSLKDMLTYARGSHTIVAGGMIRHFLLDRYTRNNN